MASLRELKRDAPNASDIVARTSGVENLVATSYTFSETRTGNVLILVYGNGKLLSIQEMEPDEILDYIHRLEAMIL